MARQISFKIPFLLRRFFFPWAFPAFIRIVLLQNSISKVDKKAMIRNRYNRIPHPVPNTEWKRDTYNGTKITTTQVKSQGNSSFPTESGRSLTIRINHNRSIALLCGGGGGGLKPRPRFCCGSYTYKLFCLHE